MADPQGSFANHRFGADVSMMENPPGHDGALHDLEKSVTAFEGPKEAPMAQMNWDYLAGRPRYEQPTDEGPVDAYAEEAPQTSTDHQPGFSLLDRTLAGFIDESSDEDDADNGFQEHPMDLRMRTFKFIDPTTIDRDESGDYDPKAKPKQAVKTAIRRKKAAPTTDSTPNGHSSGAPPTEKQIRQEGQQYIFDISFSSKPALKKFKALANKYGDNWPENKHLLWDDSQLHPEPATDSGYALRTRRQVNDTKYDDYYLRNTPAARMCKRCYEFGDNCSMARPNGSYPCESCMDSSEQCVMLVDPKRKASCESCRSDKMPCSYVQHPAADHSTPCVRCEKRGYTCIAGPAWDPLRTRIGIDGKPATPRPSLDTAVISYTRGQKTCAPCRRHGYWCSLVDDKRNPVPPCAHCQRFCTPCTFEAVPHSEGYTRMPVRSAFPQKRKSKKEREEEADSVTITTALSHPIKFLCGEPEDPHTISCHWCMSPNALYPIFGHGSEKTVRVLEWPSGLGYEELEGGHVAEGHDASRMCVRCTTQRYAIMTCAHSEFKLIADVPAKGAESEEDLTQRMQAPESLIMALMALGDKHKGTKYDAEIVRKEQSKWCSMCPNPAHWACCALKTQASADVERLAVDINALIRAESTDNGCSLRMCWACKQLYSSFFGGNFSEFVNALVEEAPEAFYSRGLRADASLLTSHGLLRKYLLAHWTHLAH